MYLRIAGVFFLADTTFHVLRLTIWSATSYTMNEPLWLSYLAMLFSGFFAWKFLSTGMRS
jgi:hypothetical protein